MRKFKKILVPVDLGEDSSWKEALPAAIDQAQYAGGELFVVTVVPDEPPQLAWLPDDYSERMFTHSNAELDKLVAQHVPEQTRVTKLVRQGAIYREIVKLAKEIGADLIVMASHRPELKDYLLGPNTARVTRHATCPVLVVR